MDKVIITVVGKDKVGTIAKVCVFLAGENINILDITQTIVGGILNMMLIVDISGASKEFGLIQDGLKSLGEDIGFRIIAQKEEIFTKMHRI